MNDSRLESEYLEEGGGEGGEEFCSIASRMKKQISSMKDSLCYFWLSVVQLVYNSSAGQLLQKCCSQKVFVRRSAGNTAQKKNALGICFHSWETLVFHIFLIFGASQYLLSSLLLTTTSSPPPQDDSWTLCRLLLTPPCSFMVFSYTTEKSS